MVAKIQTNMINQSGVPALDDEYTKILDVTTDPTYIFVSQTYDENAATTDKVWRCYRLTVANGSKVWATNPGTSKRTRAFVLQASAAATYTC